MPLTPTTDRELVGLLEAISSKLDALVPGPTAHPEQPERRELMTDQIRRCAECRDTYLPKQSTAERDDLYCSARCEEESRG